MRIYSVTEFRDNMASVLDQARKGRVVVRRNGQEYEIKFRKPTARRRSRSGLDVPGVAVRQPVTLDSVLEDIAASRSRVE